MVTQLEPFGQFPDGDAIAFGEPLDREQSLMLLGGQARAVGGRFAEVQEQPQRVPELGERFVLGF